MSQAATRAGQSFPGLRLLLVDDHELVREGLRRVLDTAARGWSVEEADSGEAALQRLSEHAFDMVITDLSMPGMGGVALIQHLHVHHAQLPVLVLSMHGESPYPLRSFQAGARGYVSKDRSAEELVQAVEKVAGGGIYLSAAMAESLVAQVHGPSATATSASASTGAGGAGGPGGVQAQLSEREREIMRRLVRGERPTEIADAMQLSVKTVSTHKARLLAKLGLPSLAALIRYALDNRS
jgi:DNA-binding NarL/FixJ family response regulator